MCSILVLLLHSMEKRPEFCRVKVEVGLSSCIEPCWEWESWTKGIGQAKTKMDGIIRT